MATILEPEVLQDEDFAWDDLLDYIQAGKIVPVLGHELLRADYAGESVTLQQLLARRLAGQYNLGVDWTPHFELSEAVSAYLGRPGAKPSDLYPRISRQMRGLEPPFPVPVALRQLAEITPLDLFVSVTFDSLMARALNEARHQGKPITQEIAFSINENTAAQIEAHRVRPGAAPVVFNLFGRASTEADYAIHDEDVLEFIHDFVSHRVEPPAWLLSELRGRHLLMLGLHLPDWLGRFVLRAATKGRLTKAERSYFIAHDPVPSTTTLTEFLKRFGRDTPIHIYRSSAVEFVAELHRRWKLRHPDRDNQPTVPSPLSAAGEDEGANIFISYGRENLAAVRKLHEAISALGGKAWFDQVDLHPGDDWERNILTRIRRQVKLFVPVFSDTTASKDKGVVFQEWGEAFEQAKRMLRPRYIVPVVVDADYQGDPRRYQRVLDMFPRFEALHFGHAPDGVPDDALTALLTAEIRNLFREESR